MDCSTRLRLADLDELMKLDDRNRRAALQTFLLYLDDSLNRLSQQAASAYLTHAGVYRGSSNS